MTTIVELTDICDEQSARAWGWFTLLGERVRDTTDPTVQRLFATAAHRHAWHAELWAQRRPAIPHDAVRTPPAPAVPGVGDDLVDAYRDHLAAQRSLLARLRDAADPDLDPATLRLVTLIDADLADLQSQLP